MATIEELLRMAAAHVEAQQREFNVRMSKRAKTPEQMIREAMKAAYGARMPGAVDYYKGPDGVWRMP